MKRWGFLILLSLVISSAHSAMVEPDIEYVLSDHPDASLTDLMNDITYGLRLDSLGGSAAARTFSTTQDGARVTLLWNGMTDTVVISGQVSRNSDNLLWDIMYTLNDASEVLGSGFEVLDNNMSPPEGTGFIERGSDRFDLTGTVDPLPGIIFRALGDAHRCESPTTSGEACSSDLIARGWLRVKNEYGYDITKGLNDWLVQLTPVPIPAALPLLLSGLLGFTFFARKAK